MVHCLLLLSLCMGGFCVGSLFLFYFLVSFLVWQSSCWGRESWLLYFNMFLLSFGCLSSMSLPNYAMGLTVVCGCDVFCCAHMLFVANCDHYLISQLKYLKWIISLIIPLRMHIINFA